MWTRRIQYLFLLVLNTIGLLFYNNYIFVMTSSLLILMPLISFILMKMSIHKITVSIQLDKTSIGKKIPVDVYFDVKNKSILPVENFTIYTSIENMFYHKERKLQIVVPVVPFADRIVSFPVDSLYCGRMKIQINHFTGKDILGLFSFKIASSEYKEIFVIPDFEKTFENVGLSLKGSSEDEELQFKKGDDVSQISEIRDYIPGDKLENIHWKLSAKKEELQVKEFSMPYSDEVTILLNTSLNVDDAFLFDKLVDTYYALSNSFIKQQRPFYVCWYNLNNEDFYMLKIINEDELMESLHELYYTKLSDQQQLTYEMYNRMNMESGKLTLYITYENSSSITGNTICTLFDKVVVQCLS